MPIRGCITVDFEAIAKGRWSDARIHEPCSSCFTFPGFSILSTDAYYRGETIGAGGRTKEEAWKSAAFFARSYEIREQHDNAAKAEITVLRKEWGL